MLMMGRGCISGDWLGYLWEIVQWSVDGYKLYHATLYV